MRVECMRAIEELALSDPRVVVVASDPSVGFMPELADKHPDRFLIEGIYEQGYAGMAAGLASEGFYPFIITLAVFATRRCYEQLLLDFALHQASGCIVGFGGGFGYAPLGPTHIAVDDMMLVSAIPGSAILAPGDANEVVALTKAARDFQGLSYLRLTPTTDPLPKMKSDITFGKARILSDSAPVLFVSCGAASFAVQSAIDLLKESGIAAGALHLHTVKPLDGELIERLARRAKVVICVEEHKQIGGLASAVLHHLTSSEPPIAPQRFASVGVDDTFPSGHGDYTDLLSHYGITGTALAERARSLLAKADR